MGGAKKRSIVQAEKQQQLQAKKQEDTKAKKAPKAKAVEKRIGGIDLPDVTSKDFLSELAKMRAITPYAVASKYNLRLSVAKDLLDDLEKKEIIQYVAGSSHLRIYRVNKS